MNKRKRGTHCKDCGILLNELNTVWVSSGSRYLKCQECVRAYNRKRYQEIGANKVRETNLMKSFGMTIEEYDKLAEFQQNGCAICRLPCISGRRLAVDHNHETGEIRGLLCVKCNAVLGLINDDENLILKIIDYLKRTTWKDEIA